MAPIVRIEPNGLQTLLSHDDVMGRLSQVGWLGFIQSFNGFNLEVARAFSRTFDGTKAKIGDVQIQVTEEFIAKATSLPQKGDKWFKNMKVTNIPWRSLLTSKKSQYHIKGMPLELFNTSWHNLLLIIKQFITCEGCYDLVFYFHIRLLMVFQGFSLNLPFYLLRSLQKMSKFYQRPSPNPETNLFHHDLIRILVEFHLVSMGDNWQGFLVRNEFLPPQIDPIIDLTQGVEEPFSPKASPNSPHDFRIEIQIQMTLSFHLMPKQRLFLWLDWHPKDMGLCLRNP
jgi:hypothetical protein